MSTWNELAHWMYADVKTGRGFWYAHPLHAVHGLSEEQLYWVPDANALCMLWHVGHIAHRERLHIGRFLQGIEADLIPPQYEVFGAEWRSVDEVRGAVTSIEALFEWVRQVREASVAYVLGLGDDDWHQVVSEPDIDLTVAHWVFLTVGHGALHIGKIQMLRAMLAGERDRPC